MRRSLLQGGSLLRPPIGQAGSGTITYASATLTVTHSMQTIVADASAPKSGTHISLNLPSAVGYVGPGFLLVAAHTNSNTVNVNPISGQSIIVPGQAPLSQLRLGPLASQAPFTVVLLISDQTNWRVVQAVTNPIATIPYGPFSFRGDPSALDGAVYMSNDTGSPDVLYQAQQTNSGPAWTAIGMSPTAPIMLTPPTITGTLQVGQTLTASPGAWQNGPTFTYQWLRNTVAISGATTTTYTLQNADFGQPITVRVTGTNAIGSTSAQSASITVLASGTGVTASIPTFNSSGTAASKLVIPAGAATTANTAAAVTANQYLSMPAQTLQQASDNPGIRLIIHNWSSQASLQPWLVNTDGSLFQGTGGNLPRIEPGARNTPGLSGSQGVINMTVPGVPTSGLRVVIQNLVSDPSAYNVAILAWMV